MVKVDNADAIRRLAYEIWERAGRPSGREHEHWAEANREFARLNPPQPVRMSEQPRWNRIDAERHEAEALRKALWTPEPFSAELFGREPPRFGRGKVGARRQARPLPGAPNAVRTAARSDVRS
ncbi:DUF2934 domain-containing protein [Aurantimonas sp. C2-6-R+9]|uniref:DUF2934 domain-containing protein n=1 Tax=unclassified Aurantimonas TaxID=2638230 RepID=UPI002E19563E|nr:MULTISPECIES: DUF2934 domain-containing protein [unclassified Aurantimonas]MEC5292712.1 DUF2934 domain-containing protein [Aurantimonas sp. C2-3-R2]MEC5382931.1 DUF2934 domain-containing protein [Aurantimonas sp. C2-6-R+9]MEC5413746.1 DUF2934 domain-containing protein [Aurantimonas sp. C2-4-R8]